MLQHYTQTHMSITLASNYMYMGSVMLTNTHTIVAMALHTHTNKNTRASYSDHLFHSTALTETAHTSKMQGEDLQSIPTTKSLELCIITSLCSQVLHHSAVIRYSQRPLSKYHKKGDIMHVGVHHMQQKLLSLPYQSTYHIYSVHVMDW